MFVFNFYILWPLLVANSLEINVDIDGLKYKKTSFLVKDNSNVTISCSSSDNKTVSIAYNQANSRKILSNSHNFTFHTFLMQPSYEGTYACEESLTRTDVVIRYYKIISITNGTAPISSNFLPNNDLYLNPIEYLTPNLKSSQWMNCRLQFASLSSFNMLSASWKGGLLFNHSDYYRIEERNDEESLTKSLYLRLFKKIYDQKIFGSYTCSFSTNLEDLITFTTELLIPPILEIVHIPPPMSPDNKNWSDACKVIVANPPVSFLNWSWITLDDTSNSNTDFTVLERRKRSALSKLISARIAKKRFRCISENSLGRSLKIWPPHLNDFQSKTWWLIFGIFMLFLSLMFVMAYELEWFKVCRSDPMMVAVPVIGTMESSANQSGQTQLDKMDDNEEENLEQSCLDRELYKATIHRPKEGYSIVNSISDHESINDPLGHSMIKPKVNRSSPSNEYYWDVPDITRQ